MVTVAYKEAIKNIVQTLKYEYKPEKIILFGSYAYGKPNADSDIDLLIIKNTKRRPIDRWMEVKRILRDFSRILPVSPFVYTAAEIKERMAMKDFFLEEILKKGKVLHG